MNKNMNNMNLVMGMGVLDTLMVLRHHFVFIINGGGTY